MEDQDDPTIIFPQVRATQKALRVLGCEMLIAIDGHEVRALLDTGATHTCIYDDLARLLELPIVGEQIVGGALGQSTVQLYRATVSIKGLDGTYEIDIPGIHPPGRDRALLGRNILQHYKITWDGPAGTVAIS